MGNSKKSKNNEIVDRPVPDTGYLRTPEAAKYLGVSVSWLEQLRCFGKGPKYFKPSGGKAVFYRKDDLAAWVEALF